MTTRQNEDSPYYWWYEYLKRHDEYRLCCEKKGRGTYSWLYKHFGNVHKFPFDEWWRGHKWLFEEQKPFIIHHLMNKDEYEWCDFETTMFLGVNLLSSKRTLLKEFERLLKEFHPGDKGRPAWDNCTAEFPLCFRPNIPVLKKTLAVYDLKKSNPDLKLWQIGDRLKLNPNQMTTGKIVAGRSTLTDARRIMEATVSRYLKHAEILIHNTGEGEFPNQKNLVPHEG